MVGLCHRQKYKKDYFRLGIQNSIRLRVDRLKQWTEYGKFSLGGRSVDDKVNSWFLRASMERPFEPRPQFVKKRILRSGSVVVLRHAIYHDFSLRFDLLDNFEMAVLRELFVEKAYDLARIRFIPSTIVDCGAYRGYFSLMAYRAFPNARITAIEAHPENVKKIAEIFRVNDVQDIELRHRALSASTEDTINLYFEGSSGSLEDTFNSPGKVTHVKTVSLYDFIASDNLLLKIDIEGAEMEFFPSIIDKLPATCAVFLETHNGWSSLSPIKEKFIECGFAFQVLNVRVPFIDSFAQRLS